MTVFDAAFVARLRARWASKAPHDQPPIARIALDDDRSERDEVEALVARFDAEDVARITTRIQTADLADTWNELIVGSVLLGCGVKPRYDQEYFTADGKRTPDWTVPAASPTPEFVCDVFTLNPADDMDVRHRMQTDLEERLAAIPQAVALTYTVTGESPFSPQFNKRATHEVRQWLRSSGGQTPLAFENVEFAVALPRKSGGVVLVHPIDVFWADASRFEETVKEKADKYAILNSPFVAAVLADFRTGIEYEEVEDIMRQRAMSIFTARPNVAGVLWVERNGISHRFLSNPQHSAAAALTHLFQT